MTATSETRATGVLVGLLATAGLLIATANSYAQGSVEGDRAALVALYIATDGPNWTDNMNWLTDTPLGDWFGVETNEQGRVTQLYITGYFDSEAFEFVGNGLTGSLPAELGTLSHLRWLGIAGNSGLTGPIPPELGALPNLKEIYFANNRLTGEIPASLRNLRNLWNLNLRGNALSGEIPAVLGTLHGLTNALDLRDNALSGEIPAALGNLTNLRGEFALGGNALSGEIPAALGNLTNVKRLWLDHNRLSGSIPAALGNLSSLQSLRLAGNQLSGRVPVELAKLSLFELSIDGDTGLCLGRFVLRRFRSGILHEGSLPPSAATNRS